MGNRGECGVFGYGDLRIMLAMMHPMIAENPRVVVVSRVCVLLIVHILEPYWTSSWLKIFMLFLIKYIEF